MTGPGGIRIGSLCSGYGGLDLGVQSVLGGTIAWHADPAPAAAAILDHHWPEVPNLGDITQVDFSRVEPVCVLVAGFPCTDVSVAGGRAGLAEGTRSGLWHTIARAISTLQPCLVVLENVRGLLSTPANAPSDCDVEPCPWCLGDTGDEHSLRALGAVLADLADAGLDARWQVLRASDVGAPHRRERVFIAAWPAGPRARDFKGPDPGREDLGHVVTLLLTPTSNLGSIGGSQHPDRRKAGGHGPNLSDLVEHLLPTPRATDGTKGGPNQRGSRGDLTLPSAAARMDPASPARDRPAPGRRSAGTQIPLPGQTPLPMDDADPRS